MPSTIRFTVPIQVADDLWPSIEGALQRQDAGQLDACEDVYLKIDQAQRAGGRRVTIQATAADLDELRDQAVYVVDPQSAVFEDKRLLRAYRDLIRRVDAARDQLDRQPAAPDPAADAAAVTRGDLAADALDRTDGARRAVLLGCSATKRSDAGALPAYLRYDGPVWQTWRAAHRDLAPLIEADGLDPLDPASWPTTIVLSASEGFMRDFRPIPDYDQRMTADRARAIATDRRQLDQLEHYLQGVDELVLVCGKDYRAPVLAALRQLAAEGCALPRLRVVRGRGIGDLRAALRGYLLRAPASQNQGADQIEGIAA